MERALSKFSLHGALGKLVVLGAKSLNGAFTFNVLVAWCIMGTYLCLMQGAWKERTLTKCSLHGAIGELTST